MLDSLVSATPLINQPIDEESFVDKHVLIIKVLIVLILPTVYGLLFWYLGVPESFLEKLVTVVITVLFCIAESFVAMYVMFESK